jgi:hypothetical protein
MPSAKSIADIKSALLNPATTSHFEVEIPKPRGLTPQYLSQNGITNFDQGKLNLLCSDAILPGSTFATHDISGDYHGTIHRHAYRRLYDDRIDLSFYVDADNYLPIRYFETWMKYISGEQIAEAETGRPGVAAEQYFYRMNYPDLYIAPQGLTVTKFERSSYRNGGSQMVYNFVNAFPIAIQSMAVSYDSSSLLKCTVSFSYIRYYVTPASPTTGEGVQGTTPEQQAIINANNALQETGALATPINGFNLGGVSQSAANASGNTVSGFTVGANANIA